MPTSKTMPKGKKKVEKEKIVTFTCERGTITASEEGLKKARAALSENHIDYLRDYLLNTQGK